MEQLSGTRVLVTGSTGALGRAHPVDAVRRLDFR